MHRHAIKLLFSLAIVCGACGLCAPALAIEGHVLGVGPYRPLYGWYQDGKLISYDVGTKASTILDSNSDCNAPCFSPDGKQIVYTRNIDGTSIFICNADGSGKKKVIDRVWAGNHTPQWTSDNWIYWRSSDSMICRDIYRIRPDGTGKEFVYKFPLALQTYRLSRDGTRAASMTVGIDSNYHAICFINGSTSYRDLGFGCQGTVSPNGLYVTHNMPSHQAFRVHSFDDGSMLAEITYSGNGNCHRFAHRSDEYVTYLMENEGGRLCNWRTKTVYDIGAIVPWDFDPGVASPVLSPMVARLSHGKPSGAQQLFDARGRMLSHTGTAANRAASIEKSAHRSFRMGNRKSFN